MPFLTLSDASLAFGHVPLLDHADFQLDPGERVALIGRNLADKSYSTLVQNNPGPAITRYVPRDDRRYFGINARYEF